MATMYALALVAAVAVVSSTATPLVKRAVAYYDPNAGGGSEIDLAAPPLGEPLNVSLVAY